MCVDDKSVELKLLSFYIFMVLNLFYLSLDLLHKYTVYTKHTLYVLFIINVCRTFYRF